MVVTLRRSYSDYQTIGELEIIFDEKRSYKFATLELPWLENQKNISCIPENSYKVTRHYSTTFKECFLIENVPGRSEILIHAGNFVRNTRGCILIGTAHSDINGDGLLDVINSKMAMQNILKLLPQTFELIIFDNIYPLKCEKVNQNKKPKQ